MKKRVPQPTVRLAFEALDPAHAEELIELTSPEITKWIGGAPSTINELREQFSRMLEGPRDPANERWLNYVMRNRATRRALGRVEAAVLSELGVRAEVAFVFAPVSWGQGLAFEAMDAFQSALALNYAVVEFWATVTPGNERSIRLLHRLG